MFDLVFNSFAVAENRFILQSNVEEFKSILYYHKLVFRSITNAMKKIYSRKDHILGVKYHFANNIV